MAKKVHLTKKIQISAMHDLSSEKFSEAENLKVFGKCYNTHGHDYHIEVTVEGAIDGDSGLICDRDYFDDVLQKEIVGKFDKTHLNDHFPSTTGENVVKEFYEILKEKLMPLKLVKVRVQETPKNHFTFGGTENLFSFDL